METGCTFKRGGLCIIHNLRGTRVEDKMSVWTKKKNGMFGWVKKTKVRYVCQNDGVAKSDDVIRDTGPGMKTRVDTALCGLQNTDGRLPRGYGADYRRDGIRLRESSADGGKRKDTD